MFFSRLRSCIQPELYLLNEKKMSTIITGESTDEQVEPEETLDVNMLSNPNPTLLYL